MRVNPRLLSLPGVFSLGLLLCFPLVQKDSKQKSIRVEVEMVSLPVVVMKRDGKHVADLQKEDFRVFEDKVEQKIEGFAAADEPFSVALMLDTSGSTMLKLERIQNEAIRFVNLLHSGDSVAVLSVAEDTRLLEDFTVARGRIASAIRRTESGGATALYEAVWLALQEVLKPVRQRSALILFTDGVDTASEKASKVETIELAKESRAPIYCIYFNTQDEMQGTNRIPTPGERLPRMPGLGSSTEDYMGGRQYLSNLADYSGGMVFDALRMEDLGLAFEAIAQQLTSQYSIGYYPTNSKHDGKYRRVEVKVSRPGLYVQTRQGYFAPYDKKQK
ncbi:MAG: VWA domain-containing protein [Acidobacteriia bacterium]|nr:VWA domain-containing protein [Terriglobia bacterium]